MAAFFDFDRTLIAGFSASAFVREWVGSGRASASELARTAAAALEFQLGGGGFSDFVTQTMVMVKGLEEEQYRDIARSIFERDLATSIYPEARELVKAHQRMGHTIAVISSATHYQIDPVAEDLGIEHVMCTQVVVENGRFTGEVVHPTCYGQGKAVAARDFAAKHSVELGHSFFYTDSDEDLPLLEIVGRPRPVNPNRRLAAIAAKHVWPVLTFSSRGRPALSDFLRTALATGSIVPSFLLGLPAVMLDGRLRDAVNLTATTWGELGSALAGIHVSTRGEQHLWSHRPAVFIFNHQSAVDVLLLCKLLRRDFVGVGKKELRRYPVLGTIFQAAGMIFIDRLNHSSAVEALQPAVETLREGVSIAIAPEGTRSLTPALGTFKKGAFRIAMAAKAPVVPIVFHNALDALPKHSWSVRPTTVNVTVLEPIETGDWTLETLDHHIEDTRKRMAAAIECGYPR